MYSIQKTYLLKRSVKSLIKELSLPSKQISLFYTDINTCKSTIYKKVDSDFKKVVQKGLLTKSKEIKKPVSKKVYFKQMANTIGNKIEKKRYIIPAKESEIFIDKYLNKLNGLYILRAKFPTKKEFINFKYSKLYKEYVSKDVTKEKRYQCSQLSILGNPEKNSYDIYRIFKDIELGRDVKLNKIIFKEMKSSDAVRLLLYKEFINLRLYRDIIIQSRAKEGLKRFEKSLKKIINILQEYKDIFDKKSIQIILKNLKNLKESLKVHNHLKFINKELKNIKQLITKNEIQKIYTDIDRKLDYEKNNIDKLIKSRRTSILLKQLELIIKENNKSFITHNGQTSIFDSNKIRAKNHYEDILQKCKLYDGCNDIQSYKSIKKSANRLNNLLVNFDMLFKNRKFKDIVKLLSKIKNNISVINDSHKKEMILKVYIESLDKKPKDYDKFLKQYKAKNQKITNDSIKKLTNNFKSLKNKKNIFK